MTYADLDRYCLAKPGAVKEFPFDGKVSVYKVGGKMFALAKEEEVPLRINLKCDPLYALELRSLYDGVIPGYHMNKKHWNTVVCNGKIDERIIIEWIDDSYELIVKALPKKLRDTLT